MKSRMIFWFLIPTHLSEMYIVKYLAPPTHVRTSYVWNPQIIPTAAASAAAAARPCMNAPCSRPAQSRFYAMCASGDWRKGTEKAEIDIKDGGGGPPNLDLVFGDSK